MFSVAAMNSRRKNITCARNWIPQATFALIGIAFSGGVCGESPPAVVAAASASGSQGWTLDGSKFTARAGTAVTGDCDINGDGYADVLVGAPGASAQSEGAAFIVYGSVGGLAPPVSLNNAGFKMVGEDTSDATGTGVACVGDVDADGFDDVLIGAPFASDPVVGVSSGVVFLVYGGASLPTAIDLGALNGSDGMRINGIVSGQRLGAVVAGGGDTNGDGYSDLLLAAPNFSATATNPGQAYVIYGGNALPASFDLKTLDGGNGFAVCTTEASTLSLGSAAAMVDINGDNLADLVLGAPGASPGNKPSAGSVFVVYGKSELPAQFNINLLDGSYGFAIHSNIAGDKAGGSLSSVTVADFNGDGRADLVIGAPGAANGTQTIGHGYIVFGAPTFPASFSLSSLNGSNGMALTSPVGGDVLGYSVAGLYDINGDGLGEVIFGAPGADYGASNSGGAYVVFGRRSGLPADFALASLNGNNGFRIQGVAAADVAGQAVGRAGDLNRDGFADLLVGAPEVDLNASQADGRVYAIFRDDLIFRDEYEG